MSLRGVQKYLSDEGYRVSIEDRRNARYETIRSWLASFITLYTLLEVKS